MLKKINVLLSDFFTKYCRDDSLEDLPKDKPILFTVRKRGRPKKISKNDELKEDLISLYNALHNLESRVTILEHLEGRIAQPKKPRKKPSCSKRLRHS